MALSWSNCVTHCSARHLGIVGLEEIYVVVEDLDEELRVDPAGDAHVCDLEGPLQALQHSASVSASGRLLRGAEGNQNTERQQEGKGEAVDSPANEDVTRTRASLVGF